MAEPLAVDPTGLSAAAAKLAGLVFPQPPAPIAVSGTDSVVAAINETMPSIESLVSDGLPGVKAALTRTASNMNAAADVYAKTDQSLGTSLSQYAFGSSGEGLAGVASVGGQPSQATQLLSTPVSQVTTQLVILPLSGMSSGSSTILATPGSELANCSAVPITARSVMSWKAAQACTAKTG